MCLGFYLNIAKTVTYWTHMLKTWVLDSKGTLFLQGFILCATTVITVDTVADYPLSVRKIEDVIFGRVRPKSIKWVVVAFSVVLHIDG